ncbi:MAG: sugar phosphate nucleotidyltransferase [Candidatus Thorarchaeota archaeon]
MEILLLPQENKLKEKLIAIIPCAGKGTRIKNLSQDKPKSLIQIATLNGRSIIDYLILTLTNLRIQKIVIITGYLGSQLKEHFNAKLSDKKSLTDKLIFINSGLEYKKGPLYSFLSFTRNAKLFKKDYLFVILPCDTIFESVLLKEIFKIAYLNLNLIKNNPAVFYKKIDIRSVRKKYEEFYKNIPRPLSIIKTRKDCNEIILKKIIKTELQDTSKQNIKLMIPVIFLNYYSVKHIQEISSTYPIKTISEALNFMILRGEKILTYEVHPDLEFYDIDDKYDLMLLNSIKKKMDNSSFE